jgi:hypothetical protein
VDADQLRELPDRGFVLLGGDNEEGWQRRDLLVPSVGEATTSARRAASAK